MCKHFLWANSSQKCFFVYAWLCMMSGTQLWLWAQNCETIQLFIQILVIGPAILAESKNKNVKLEMSLIVPI